MIIPSQRSSPTPTAHGFRERLVQWATTTSQFPWFTGTSGISELRGWFTTIESACEDNEVEEKDMAEAGIMFISGDLKHVMEERRVMFLEKERDQAFWRWDDFKDDLVRIVAEAERIKAEAEKDPVSAAKDKMAQFRRDHPHIAASASVGLAVGGSIVLIPALGILALNAIGFTAGGVAAGSLAAALQSIFYGGATTGLFSILQSVGATAVLPAAGTVLASVGAVGTGLASLFSGKEEEGHRDEASEEVSPPPPYSPGPPDRVASDAK